MGGPGVGWTGNVHPRGRRLRTPVYVERTQVRPGENLTYPGAGKIRLQIREGGSSQADNSLRAPDQFFAALVRMGLV